MWTSEYRFKGENCVLPHCLWHWSCTSHTHSSYMKEFWPCFRLRCRKSFTGRQCSVWSKDYSRHQIGHEISNSVAMEAWPLTSAGFFFTNSMYLYKHTDYRPELKQLWKPINHCEPNRFRNHLARSLRCVQSFGQMKNVVNKAASEHIRKARRAGLWSEWGQGRTRDQQMNFDLITKSEPDLVSYRRRRTFTDCEWVSDERESSQLHTADKLADKSLTLQHSLKHIFHV